MDNRKLGHRICLGGCSTRYISVDNVIIADRLLRLYIHNPGESGRDRRIDSELCLELGRLYARGAAGHTAYKQTQGAGGGSVSKRAAALVKIV
jgi:hypothetical protein